MRKYLVTFANGNTTIMSRDQLIANKELLLLNGADWEPLS